MRKLLLRWTINAVALYIAVTMVSGISAEGGWLTYLWIALILGLANALIAPIIKVLTCPLIILTLGLFTFVINAAMLLLASEFVARFQVDGFGPAFQGAVIISIVSFVLSILTGAYRKDDDDD